MAPAFHHAYADVSTGSFKSARDALQMLRALVESWQVFQSGTCPRSSPWILLPRSLDLLEGLLIQHNLTGSDMMPELTSNPVRHHVRG